MANALPQTITAAGAGKTGDNVTLTLQSGPDSDGYSYYVGGGCGVYFNNYAGLWYLTNPSQGVSNNWTSSGGTPQARPSYVDYQSMAGQSFSAFPMTGWTTANAPGPAPAWNGASGGSTLPPVSAADALLSDHFSASGLTRAAALLADNLLSDALQASPRTAAPAVLSDALLGDSFAARFQSGPRTASALFVDALLLDGLAAGPRTGAPALFVDALLLDAVSPVPRTLAPASFASVLLEGGFAAAPRSYAPLTLTDPLLSGTGGRTGAGSAAGGTSPPFVLSDGLLWDSAAAGPQASGPRRLADALLADALTRTGHARFATFSDALLGDRLIAFPVQPEAPGGVDDRDPFVVLAAELRRLLTLAQGDPYKLVSTLLSLTDKIAAAYRINDLSQAANTLAALPTLIRGGDGVTSTVYGFGQDAPILALLPAAESLIAGSAPNVLLAAQYRGFLSALAGYASSLKSASFDAYLTSLNTPVPFQALVHPNFALLNWLFNNQQGPLLMSPGNVFAPQTTFGTALAGPSAGSVAFSHLSDIPSANVVSAVAGQSTQGYTAAPGVVAAVSQAVNGTLTVTLIGFGQNAAGQAVAGRSWTAVLDNAAAGSTAAFVPATPGDRLHGITSLSGQGAATAGAFVLNSVLERVVS